MVQFVTDGLFFGGLSVVSLLLASLIAVGAPLLGGLRFDLDALTASPSALARVRCSLWPSRRCAAFLRFGIGELWARMES